MNKHTLHCMLMFKLQAKLLLECQLHQHQQHLKKSRIYHGKENSNGSGLRLLASVSSVIYMDSHQAKFRLKLVHRLRMYDKTAAQITTEMDKLVLQLIAAAVIDDRHRGRALPTKTIVSLCFPVLLLGFALCLFEGFCCVCEIRMTSYSCQSWLLESIVHLSAFMHANKSQSCTILARNRHWKLCNRYISLLD
jgi:hypothetical protein